jgi:diguanylate cyclase (GGDEF)-like protein
MRRRPLPLTTVALAGAAVLLFIAVSIGAVLKVTVDHLLYSEAKVAAESWAKYVAENVEDVEAIAKGAMPSADSMNFFIRTRQIRNVFGFEITDLEGRVQLVSDGWKITSPHGAIRDDTAARAAKSDSAIIEVRDGTPPHRPAHYSQAYLPMRDGSAHAVVAAYVDLTENYEKFRNAFLASVLTLCVLTGAGISIPMIAWQRLTRLKQEADRRILFLAAHDPLTTVMNRSTLIERLGLRLAALEPGGGMAVHFVDVDHFKDINDRFGHDGGDVVLRALTSRFTAITRSDDTVGRFGGDEIVVIQSDARSREQATAFAERLREAAAEPVPFNEQDILVTVSVGVAIAPEDGRDPDGLLKSADLALYVSKAAGRNCVRIFSPSMNAELAARIKLEKTIRDAVANEGFVLHFQPMFELGGKLIGFEALLRLPAEDGSLIAPLVFLPVAEDLRLMDQIGAWVLREACRVAAGWPDDLTIAVNISPSQFALGNISIIVARVLQETGLAPRRLEIEITESLLLKDTEAAVAELNKLKAMGVSIVMDDFGTGYSSLSYLWRFPFNKIKIDRSFIVGLDSSGRKAESVIKTIIALGRELQMRVTVEGVETPKQAAFLEAIPGDQAQGFLFGRPVPAKDITPDFLAALRQPQAARKAAPDAAAKALAVT